MSARHAGCVLVKEGQSGIPKLKYGSGEAKGNATPLFTAEGTLFL
jgi:hypothetical protein